MSKAQTRLGRIERRLDTIQETVNTDYRKQLGTLLDRLADNNNVVDPSIESIAWKLVHRYTPFNSQNIEENAALLRQWIDDKSMISNRNQ